MCRMKLNTNKSLNAAGDCARMQEVQVAACRLRLIFAVKVCNLLHFPVPLKSQPYSAT